MPKLTELAEFGRAAWRTWGAAALGRRAGYELRKRTGRLAAAEETWQRRPKSILAVRSAGIVVPVVPDVVSGGRAVEGIELYGGLALDAALPPDWHLHPLTGHRFPRDVHWSTLGDADPIAGDIKDVWELSRFGWLFPRLRAWAATGDDRFAEEIWTAIEDWHRANPPYLGPHWMCGQETSLRTIAVLFLADALRDSPTTTVERQALVATIVDDAVGRVAPTLGYARSQRNNHAISEASFLWTATVLAPDLPGADRLRRRAATALTDSVNDQFAADGAYSQHSPTYERVALHGLLWCLAVARGTGATEPGGVVEAVARGAAHLRSLLVPGGDGAVPNLGGNDGAHVFALTDRPIGDIRPLLVHSCAATGGTTDLPTGPWDEEAAWFGLAARRSVSPTLIRGSVTRAMTVAGTHAVFRAGRLSHRPAHADQLHLDVWFDGRPIAVDAGSYRYTAPAPWANALADEDVHNVPLVSGTPQAERAGRFFWRRWCEAEVIAAAVDRDHEERTARLVLSDGNVIVRAVRVSDGTVEVTDRLAGDRPGTVRWNLVGDPEVRVEDGTTEVRGPVASVRISHAGRAIVRRGVDDDPKSGWHAPIYGTRQPLTAVEVLLEPDHPTTTTFTRA